MSRVSHKRRTTIEVPLTLTSSIEVFQMLPDIVRRANAQSARHLRWLEFVPDTGLAEKARTFSLKVRRAKAVSGGNMCGGSQMLVFLVIPTGINHPVSTS